MRLGVKPWRTVRWGAAKAEPLISLCHGLDAVQPDIAVARIGEHGFGQRQTKALAAIVRRHDVEADKGKLRIVGWDRTARDHPSIEHARKEAVGIDGMETGRVAQAGVPALSRGPVDGEIELRKRHPADAILTRRIAHRRGLPAGAA